MSSSAPGAFATTNPRTEERRISAYRIDPSKSPSHIDVTTQFDSVLKGIYTFEGDGHKRLLGQARGRSTPHRVRGPARLRSHANPTQACGIRSEAGPFRIPPTLVRGG